ncbi:hypothetical protein ACFX2A_035721 [Malus domestica]
MTRMILLITVKTEALFTTGAHFSLGEPKDRLRCCGCCGLGCGMGWDGRGSGRNGGGRGRNRFGGIGGDTGKPGAHRGSTPLFVLVDPS